MAGNRAKIRVGVILGVHFTSFECLCIVTKTYYPLPSLNVHLRGLTVLIASGFEGVHINASSLLLCLFYCFPFNRSENSCVNSC